MAKIKFDNNGRVLSVEQSFKDSFILGEKITETETSITITDWLGRKKTYIKSQGIQLS